MVMSNIGGSRDEFLLQDGSTPPALTPTHREVCLPLKILSDDGFEREGRDLHWVAP
jgi:hypothetical protein